MMKIASNSRQMPSHKNLTSDKDYCDLLYAWLQCNSERIDSNSAGRRLLKKDCKWQTIEKKMTRIDAEGNEIKVMARKTIAKYFNILVEKGLIQDQGDEYYYLTVLNEHEAYLIEYNTLAKLINVFQRHCISIYICLLNQYISRGCSQYQITLAYLKEYIGIATSTSSNNMIVDDTLDILQRLGLLGYGVVRSEDGKSHIQINWVKNQLS